MSLPDEIARIYDEHAQALFAYLMTLTRSETDTHDLLQEVFVRLATRERLLEGVASERGFLIRLAHNLAVDAMRRRDTRSRNHDQFGLERQDELATGADPDAMTLQATMESALNTLPEEQRTVVHLKTWGGLTFEEIATALDILPNTAASRYRYGIDKIREQLRPYYNEIQ